MTDYALPKLNFGIIPLLVAAGLMALAIPSSLGQAGAATTPTSSLPANAPYVPTMTFDVASVRENKNVDVNAGITMSGRFVPHTTMLRVINWRIEDLISYAYGVHSVSYTHLLLLFFWSFLYGYTVFPYKHLASSTNYALRFDILYLLENFALVLAAGILTLRVQAPWKSIYLHLFGASALYTLGSTVANIAIDSGGYVNGKLYGLALTASVCWFVWIPLRARQLSAVEAETTQPSGKSRASSLAMVVVVVISIPLLWELFHLSLIHI